MSLYFMFGVDSELFYIVISEAKLVACYFSVSRE